MAANRVHSSISIASVSKGSKHIKCEYASRTDAWIRASLDPGVQKDFVDALEKADIPDEASVAILTYLLEGIYA
ncbi:predicted protein [Sclerotinia sclerotiorum 1980 UF-70]|uniref:Uncharacterized protein n=2 Tax=Sclerotinia sclerotiorum (strain ATCC 18683 / 1980 / Ss-1) TaxID=665079 RepID=A7EXM0_SCLS1|nr:predicted protein [Sclerotinia sclerotiorum 1980 UF-70]APA15990.1 hypothetical protein sscle_16g107600 [Sclerotinia sclerotiorum 1980 UF-70]EDN94212.1 predicted protein [Sclerotinia sclerotiorum 1980 UF-70]